MSKLKLIVAGGSLLALTTLGAGSLLAAPHGGGCDHQAGSGWGAMRGEARGLPDFGARAEARLGDLKAGLKLRPEQEAAWNEFRGALLSQAEQMQEKMTTRRASADAKTALERLEQAQEGADQRRAALDAVAQATKAFYPTLDKEQKAFFDENFRLMPGKRGGHRHPA